MTIFNKIIISVIVVAFTFGVMSYFAGTDFALQSAQAQTTCGACNDPEPTPDPDPKPTNPPICQISTNLSVVPAGNQYTITWNGTPSNASFQINGFPVAANDSATYTFDDAYDYERFVFYGENNDGRCAEEVIIYKEVPGCTDADASNYNEKANVDDGSCEYTPDPLPSCDVFTATPSVFGPGGGTATLEWETTDATTVSINNGIGEVTADGTQDVTITGDITYTLTAENTTGSVSCVVPIIVEPPVVDLISCEKNVTFTASTQSLPRGGGNVDFVWSTTGLDSVSFTGLTATTLSGSESKHITSDETITLIGTKGSQSISCPLSIDVKTGGGHSSNPTCKLTISDEKISKGEEVSLVWKTNRSKEVLLTDSNGNTLLDSKDASDMDGNMTVKPLKDTTYTLTAKRGVKERVCTVDVHLENNVTVLETRTAQPRVAGIALTQVPYTGFDAGPALTIFFYVLLTLWGLFVAYVLVIRRDSIGGVSLAGSHDHVPFTDVSTDADPVTNEPIAEEYVEQVVASSTATTPANLPTGDPVVGYAALAQSHTDDEAVDASIEMTELENRAHAQNVLLSSDAMRFFMKTTQAEDRNEKMDALIAQAKAVFPSEGGWVALNLARIETLLADDQSETHQDAQVRQAVQTETNPTPITGGSLAEAIVVGDVVNAYHMIANRPMIALADAASDLDAVYRLRKGEKVSVSDMLVRATENLTNAQLENAITALTGAVDGTYDNEAQAVKMAIMKAVKAVA